MRLLSLLSTSLARDQSALMSLLMRNCHYSDTLFWTIFFVDHDSVQEINPTLSKGKEVIV